MKSCDWATLPLVVHPVKSPVSKPPLTTRSVGGGGDDAVGASTVTAKTADAALVPFASVSVAVKLCVPTVSPLSSKLQAPLAFTEAWPTDVVPSNTLTVLLASPVPVNVIEVAVVWSPTGDVSGENEAMTGAAGGVGGGGGGAEPVACTTDTSSNCHAEGSCRKSNCRGVLVLVAV